MFSSTSQVEYHPCYISRTPNALQFLTLNLLKFYKIFNGLLAINEADHFK